MINLLHGDCLELMKDIPDNSIDMVLTDPPYGTTACKWDTVIDFDLMWKQLKRITKDNGAIVLTASQPFTSNLVMSNVKDFRHEWIYQKRCASNFAQAKYAPMKEHESVLVFGNMKPNYYPTKENRVGGGKSRIKYKFSEKSTQGSGEFVGNISGGGNVNHGELRIPSSVRLFNNRAKGQRGLHPTQKPVALLEYLIKTYTLENEVVLDFTMGSGSTGVAAKNLNRKFIGIEMADRYFEIAKERIDSV
tara:strand:+ start:99 stop:842 length:744 start_codon:yes stop_codon:yes gene_type:complete